MTNIAFLFILNVHEESQVQIFEISHHFLLPFVQNSSLMCVKAIIEPVSKDSELQIKAQHNGIKNAVKKLPS